MCFAGLLVLQEQRFIQSKAVFHKSALLQETMHPLSTVASQMYCKLSGPVRSIHVNSMEELTSIRISKVQLPWPILVTGHMSNVQNPYDIPLYWLVHRDPYTGLL